MGSSFRFCTLVLLAVLISGCPRAVVPPPPPPPPPTTHDHPNSVTLQVQGGTSGYSCTFTGGDNDNKGNIEVKHSEGDVNVHVNLSAGPNFAIVDPYFDNDPMEQLHGKPTDAGRKAVIHDTNTGPLNAYYGLIVQDNSTSPATKFVCDPGIVNN